MMFFKPRTPLVTLSCRVLWKSPVPIFVNYWAMQCINSLHSHTSRGCQSFSVLMFGNHRFDYIKWRICVTQRAAKHKHTLVIEWRSTVPKIIKLRLLSVKLWENFAGVHFFNHSVVPQTVILNVPHISCYRQWQHGNIAVASRRRHGPWLWRWI